MRILLDNVPARGIDLPLSLDLPWVQDGLVAAFEGPATSLTGRLQVHRLSDGFRVHGRLETQGPVICGRCGDPLELWLGGDFDLFYGPLGDGETPTTHTELALADDQVDRGYFEDGAIEMEAVFAEQLVLWQSPTARCEDVASENERVISPRPKGSCIAPTQPPAPDLAVQSPFATLRLPE